jgi:hypothetical protein
VYKDTIEKNKDEKINATMNILGILVYVIAS